MAPFFDNKGVSDVWGDVSSDRLKLAYARARQALVEMDPARLQAVLVDGTREDARAVVCHVGDDGESLLHLAAQYPHPMDMKVQDAIRLLLSQRAEVGFRDSIGETPLVMAVRAALGALERPTSGGVERLRIVRMLLEEGADPEACDRVTGETPLMEAASALDASLCSLLVDAKADPQRRSANGLLAASFVESAGPHCRSSSLPEESPTHRTLAILRNSGGDPMHAGTMHSKASTNAEERPDLSILEELKGAVVAVRPDLVQQVIMSLTDPEGVLSLRDEDGLTLLHVSVMSAPKKGVHAIVECLLQSAAEVDCRSILGETPVLLATRAALDHRCDLEDNDLLEGSWLLPLRELLCANADPNLSDILGESPLMEAACEGDAELTRLLLEARADPSNKSYVGLTALVFAAMEGHQRVAEILEEALPKHLLFTPIDENSLPEEGNAERSVAKEGPEDLGMDENGRDAQGSVGYGKHVSENADPATPLMMFIPVRRVEIGEDRAVFEICVPVGITVHAFVREVQEKLGFATGSVTLCDCEGDELEDAESTSLEPHREVFIKCLAPGVTSKACSANQSVPGGEEQPPDRVKKESQERRASPVGRGARPGSDEAWQGSGRDAATSAQTGRRDTGQAARAWDRDCLGGESARGREASVLKVRLWLPGASGDSPGVDVPAGERPTSFLAFQQMLQRTASALLDGGGNVVLCNCEGEELRDPETTALDPTIEEIFVKRVEKKGRPVCNTGVDERPQPAQEKPGFQAQEKERDPGRTRNDEDRETAAEELKRATAAEMARASNNVFDFDDLTAAEASSKIKAPSAPGAGEVDEGSNSNVSHLRKECLCAGLQDVDWCEDPAVLKTLLTEARRFEKASAKELKSICMEKAINVENVVETCELRRRLRQVIIWSKMPQDTLNRECSRRGVNTQKHNAASTHDVVRALARALYGTVPTETPEMRTGIGAQAPQPKAPKAQTPWAAAGSAGAAKAPGASTAQASVPRTAAAGAPHPAQPPPCKSSPAGGVPGPAAASPAASAAAPPAGRSFRASSGPGPPGASAPSQAAPSPKSFASSQASSSSSRQGPNYSTGAPGAAPRPPPGRQGSAQAQSQSSQAPFGSRGKAASANSRQMPSSKGTGANSRRRGPGDSDEEDARGDERRRSSAGPKVRKVMKKFPHYMGEMPPSEAELDWTEDEIYNFFYTDGFVRPKRKPKGPPKVPKHVIDEHYRTLGLPSGSKAAVVRKAYRKLALKYHPDKNKGSATSTAKFQELTEAYETILSQLERKDA